MHSDGGLNIGRIDGELIVRSRRTTINWLGVLFTGFALYWAMTWNGHDARDELTYRLGLALGIAFIAIGIALLLPRSIVTIFDLRSQSVRRSMNIFGWTYRDHTYPFADIAGIGIVEGSDTDNRDPLPVLVLKAGPTLPLDTVRTYCVECGELESAKAIEAICAATGLQKCDDLSQTRRGQKAVRGEDEAKNQTSPVSWSRIVSAAKRTSWQFILLLAILLVPMTVFNEPHDSADDVIAAAKVGILYGVVGFTSVFSIALIAQLFGWAPKE